MKIFDEQIAESKVKPIVKTAVRTFAGAVARLCIAFSVCLLIIGYGSVKTVYASNDGYYRNDETGYSIVIIDKADYLSESEEDELIDSVRELTEYTNVVYLTDEDNTYALESFSEDTAEDAAHGLFGGSANTIVYVVDNEYDYIYAQGKVMRTITNSKAYNITDNVYMYSADEKYLEGAKEAFAECLALLKGGKISNNMKYICNAFLALFISSIVCYAVISHKSKLKYTGGKELIKGAICYAEISKAEPVFTFTQKTYSPRSSSGGGHGGGGHGGGGHSGGGHSGGGHSH